MAIEGQKNNIGRPTNVRPEIKVFRPVLPYIINLSTNKPRRIVIITDGYNDPNTAKTAVCLLRYRADDVVAVFDPPSAGRTCQAVFGVGGQIPCVGSLADAADADALVVGIAPPGGHIPPHWRTVVLEAISRKMSVISGLHDFLGDDPEFRAAAELHGVELVDVRRNDEHDVANRVGIRQDCLRIHTVANDCCCGKMVAALEIARGLQRAGVDAAFVATGQTGIMIAGEGCPIDRVVSDFVSGAAEKLVLANQRHDVIVVEGQGSLFRPRYSGVALGLLHGVMPDGLVLCHDMGRRTIFGPGMESIPLAPPEKVIEFYEAAANIMHPCRVIGIAVNGRDFSDEAVAAECENVNHRLGLPACDLLRHGPERLVEAIVRLQKTRQYN
jgi:uncharacterized NAD-dependent epimerase/dehydratase family protein